MLYDTGSMHWSRSTLPLSTSCSIDEGLIGVLLVSIAHTLAHVLAFCEQRHSSAGENVHAVVKQGVMQQSS